MKKLCFMMCIIILFFSTTCFAENLKSLEDLIFCKQDANIMALVEKIEKEDGFKKDGMNFYKPQKGVYAFGYEVDYIGLMGVSLVPGPNITVKGKYEEVEKSIKVIHKGEFKCGPGGCDSKIDKYNHLMIYPHPSEKDLTIIQCGYFGP